ncbi:MAG TPA: 50S ribosomal protein L4 [Candidatus Saccharimonadales bacterium]|nr:50S ribosomal protein L4 [Candidatus Saccharimonadales bacterium]
MAVPTYTKTGTKAATSAKLDKAVFGVEVANHELLKQAYVAYMANGRDNLAVVKTRGLVRGGGKKPWRQKGTGRARFGSSRNPIWRGGGITFGPTGEENYSKQLNTKAKRQAIRQALSLASEANKVAVIEDITSKTGKTAELAKLMNKLNEKRTSLVVVENKTAELTRAAQNLQNVKLVSANYVNVYDVLNADLVVFTQKALSATCDWLNGKAAKSSTKEAA